ncbi:MAG: LptE family protein [Deltaproteobacteria bacterium]|nr:LptE family protein [Deltaproteobacteria bacterium]
MSKPRNDNSRRGRGLRPVSRLAGMVLLLLLFSACGYRLRGTQSLAGDYRTVAVQPFVNRTYESLIENYLYNTLVQEFAQSKNLRVVRAADADLLISGVITGVESHSISYSPDDKSYEYRVTLTINVEAVDARSQKVVWRRKGMQEVEEYKANLEPLEIDRNRQVALKRACMVLAEDIHDRLFTDF